MLDLWIGVPGAAGCWMVVSFEIEQKGKSRTNLAQRNVERLKIMSVLTMRLIELLLLCLVVGFFCTADGARKKSSSSTSSLSSSSSSSDRDQNA